MRPLLTPTLTAFNRLGCGAFWVGADIFHGHKPEATMQIYKETAQSYPRDTPPHTHHFEGSRHRHKKHQGWELGVWGWTALKWLTQETVWFFFPPKPLSVKWGYDKNCPEELVAEEH